jgi:hypothetical protein
MNAMPFLKAGSPPNREYAWAMIGDLARALGAG